MMGLAIGTRMGNNKTGRMNDLFLTYIESAETRVPVTHKLKVGKTIANNIKPHIGIIKIIPDGLEMNNPKSTKINSITLRIIKLNIILLRNSVFADKGEEISPSRVPDSFSLMNNLAIMKINVKKTINQISITNISVVIACSWVLTLYTVEKMNTEIMSNNNIEKRSLICLISDLRSFNKIVFSHFISELFEVFFPFN